MLLPKAPAAYSEQDQAQLRGELERADKQNMKIDGGVVLKASDGSRWKLVVDTSGNLSTSAA
jgi:hypothetical protein